MRFIAFAQSSAVVVSSNTNVNGGDELDCPRRIPDAPGGRPQSTTLADCQLGPQ